jgi:hypothetical protein
VIALVSLPRLAPSRWKVRDRLAVRQVFRLPERQVLDQVGEPELGILLVERARVDPHADRDLPRRHAVVAHRVAQPVGHLAEQPLFVDRDVGAAIDPRIVGLRVARDGGRLDSRDRRRRGLLRGQRQRSDQEEGSKCAERARGRSHCGAIRREGMKHQ